MNAIANDEKKIKYELFMDYCKYQNLPHLLKDLYPSIIIEKRKTLSKINYDAMIVLRNDIDRKNITTNEETDKIINIIKRILIYDR